MPVDGCSAEHKYNSSGRCVECGDYRPKEDDDDFDDDGGGGSGSD